MARGVGGDEGRTVLFLRQDQSWTTDGKEQRTFQILWPSVMGSVMSDSVLVCVRVCVRNACVM